MSAKLITHPAKYTEIFARPCQLVSETMKKTPPAIRPSQARLSKWGYGYTCSVSEMLGIRLMDVYK